MKTDVCSKCGGTHPKIERLMKKGDKCAQCGWTEENHHRGFCYHYSDEDTDYFYTDRKFISEKFLKGKKYHTTFNGIIVIDSLSDTTLNQKTYERFEGKD